MANRAYLYTVDQKPNNENRDGVKIRGLSEWKYRIPLGYMMLISGDPKPTSSLIWKQTEKIAVLGKYKDGINNFEDFLNLIKSNDPQHPEVFNRVMNESLEYLKSREAEYILLEVGEILEMASDITEEATQQIVDDSKELAKAAKEGNIEILNSYFGDNLLTHWEELGIDGWTDILYFNINQN